MKKMYSGKMTSKGQVTIPHEIREIYGLSEGDRLEFVLNESSPEYLSVLPVRKKSIADVAGLLSSSAKASDLTVARDQAIDQHIKHKYRTSGKDLG